jgi:hypothetical protein
MFAGSNFLRVKSPVLANHGAVSPIKISFALPRLVLNQLNPILNAFVTLSPGICWVNLHFCSTNLGLFPLFLAPGTLRSKCQVSSTAGRCTLTATTSPQAPDQSLEVYHLLVGW